MIDISKSGTDIYIEVKRKYWVVFSCWQANFYERKLNCLSCSYVINGPLKSVDYPWNILELLFKVLFISYYPFTRSLTGCSEYADTFVGQEIDGQALMLLREEHMVVAMNMKLGPALKIISKVTQLKRASLKDR